MKLCLIRHAKADEQGERYPDDNLRPLIAKGFKQSQTLNHFFEQTGVSFDMLFSSPLLRAEQTSDALKSLAKTIVFLDSLAASNYETLIKDINAKLKTSALSIALVGHEPYLSELNSYLLTGRTNLLKLEFKKAAFVTLEGNLAAHSMTLINTLPYKIYKQLLQS